MDKVSPSMLAGIEIVSLLILKSYLRDLGCIFNSYRLGVRALEEEKNLKVHHSVKCWTTVLVEQPVAKPVGVLITLEV